MKHKNHTYVIIAALLSIIAPFTGFLAYGISTLIEKGLSVMYWKFSIEPFGFSFDGHTTDTSVWVVMFACYAISAFLIWKLYKQYKAGVISSRMVIYPAIILGLSIAWLISIMLLGRGVV